MQTFSIISTNIQTVAMWLILLILTIRIGLLRHLSHMMMYISNGIKFSVFQSTAEITPWDRVLLEILRVAQLVKKFPVF